MRFRTGRTQLTRRTKNVGGLSERKKEVKRRRHRLKKLKQLRDRLEKVRPSQRTLIADKVRKLTPGGVSLLKTWGYEEK